ncbi:MAG: aminotransferase class III-fold pyridoxal phosphate-dependent enzyme [Paracoccaceae bacterium]
MTRHETSTNPKQKRGGPIQVFCSGDGHPLPEIDRAEGVYMWDTDRKRYLDGSSGPVICNPGHSNARVLKAMADQAAKVCFASRAVFENAPNRRLAEKFVALAGPGFDQAFIVSGGSEATEAAITLAHQYAVSKGEAGRWKVLARNPSYHGATLGAVSITGDPQSEAVFEAVTRIMPKVPAPFGYRLPEGVNAETHAMACANALEDIIRSEGPEIVLAFIMEPVGGLATNSIVAPVVAAGGFLHGHTYSANPLSCAVAEAVPDEIIDRDLMLNATEISAYLRAQLGEVAAASHIVGDIRGKGLLMAAEIVADKTTKAILPARHRAVYRLRDIGIEKGLLLYTGKTVGGAFGKWVMISPPLTLARAEADELVALFSDTIAAFEAEIRAQGAI